MTPQQVIDAALAAIGEQVAIIRAANAPAPPPDHPPVPTYTLTTAAGEVGEGTTVVFVLRTEHVPPGTVLGYALSGVTEADVLGGVLTGAFTTDEDGDALAYVTLLADSLTEGDETLLITLDGGLAALSVLVRDTSLTPPPVEPPPDPGPSPRSQILRPIRLGQARPFLASKNPNRGEDGTYNRNDTCVPFLSTNIKWTWVFARESGGPPAIAGARVRLLIDGVAATDWQAPDDSGAYTFNATVPNGWHLGHAEVEGFPHLGCYACPCIVNDTGAPLPGPATPWTATTRFEHTKRGIGNVALQFRYGAAPPVTRPLKPRVIEPFNALLPKTELWVRHAQASTDAGFTRRWVLSPTGDIVIEADQKYFHSTAVTKHPEAGQQIETWPARSGPRGQGTLLYVCDMRIRGGPKDLFPLYGNGAYFLETNGRLGLLNEQGAVINELGLHMGSMPLHAGVKRSTYMHAATHPEHAEQYDSKFDDPANWAQVKGKHGLWEPWGFEVLYRDAAGQIQNRDGHEFWVCDTLNHRMIYADHWPAHSDKFFEPAHLAPPWYEQVKKRTGRTAVCNFAGSLDGLPTEFFNEPWQTKWNRFDGKLYWTNHAGNSIARCNLDGSGAEIVIRSALQPTDMDLGLPHLLVKGVSRLHRLSQSSIDPIKLRERWWRDGKIGVASCVRPTALCFDSKGRLMWIENHTYAVRRLDLGTGIVETVCTVLDTNGGSESSGNNEPNMVVDYSGTCGPTDDIFVWAWSNNTDRRYSADGVMRAKPWNRVWPQGGSAAPLLCGPMHQANSPNYGWGFDVYGGRMMAVGSAAGAQLLDISRRLPTDPVPDVPRYVRGRDAWLAAGFTELALGPGGGQGELGLPTYEEVAGWPDEDLHALLASLGVAAPALSDVAYFVRWGAVDHVVA